MAFDCVTAKKQREKKRQSFTVTVRHECVSLSGFAGIHSEGPSQMQILLYIFQLKRRLECFATAEDEETIKSHLFIHAGNFLQFLLS